MIVPIFGKKTKITKKKTIKNFKNRHKTMHFWLKLSQKKLLEEILESQRSTSKKAFPFTLSEESKKSKIKHTHAPKTTESSVILCVLLVKCLKRAPVWINSYSRRCFFGSSRHFFIILSSFLGILIISVFKPHKFFHKDCYSAPAPMNNYG